MKTFTAKLLPVCAAVAVAFTAPAQAASLSLSKEIFNINNFGDTLIGGGAVTALSAPSSSSYGNNISGTFFNYAPLQADANYTFADFYYIDVPASTINASAISIDLAPLLAITNLHFNLYSGLVSDVHPAGAALISSADLSGGGLHASLGGPVDLTAGLYTLQLLGKVTGVYGASYAGTVNLVPAPVPVPAAVWLLGSALTSVVVTGRRKNA